LIKLKKNYRKNQSFKSSFDYIGDGSVKTIVSKYNGGVARFETGSTSSALYLLSSI
jgi:hypothetical protein